jgi:hypothetical protein
MYLDWLHGVVAQTLPHTPCDLNSYLQVLNNKSASNSQDINRVHHVLCVMDVVLCRIVHNISNKLIKYQNLFCDTSVGTANCYGLYGPRIESRWGVDFLHLSMLALGPTHFPLQRVRFLSRGLKRPGHGTDHPPPSSAEVKERVELCLYSPFGPSWPVLGWTVPFLPYFVV